MADSMQYLGIEYGAIRLPELDQSFVPLGAWMRAYEAQATHELRIAIESANGRIVTRETALIADGAHDAADYRYLERLVKFLLWGVGGFRVTICGADALTERLKRDYAEGGARAFDAGFMDDVFERGLVIESCKEADFPAAAGEAVSIGGHTKGCRIGFDAGGSDRKVSAVVDGVTVYSEEVVWHPKTQSDPNYHLQEIVRAFQTAAGKMPRVDAIGVSSAGVFVGNSPMVSSLFLKVPRSERAFVKDIYHAAARALGNVPLAVANDGDVTALAGSMELQAGCVMGLAMGTSEAVGYVNAEGNILGWFNELAFAPVDLNEHAMRDEWSGDLGVGCKYLSQDAVIKLAPAAGITLSDALSPAEKLSAVQKLLESGIVAAEGIYRSIGVYLAHAIALYDLFYEIRHLLLLGRVVSGEGGRLIETACRETLACDYPALSERIHLLLPDEESRRVGQSVAAASLPNI